MREVRERYIARDTDGVAASYAVILAGVTNVKCLRNRIRDQDQHKVNSPWNIATEVDVDMSLSDSGIEGVQDEYEADHHSRMTQLQSRDVFENIQMDILTW